MKTPNGWNTAPLDECINDIARLYHREDWYRVMGIEIDGLEGALELSRLVSLEIAAIEAKYIREHKDDQYLIIPWRTLCGEAKQRYISVDQVRGEAIASHQVGRLDAQGGAGE